MVIKQHVEYDGSKFSGYTDMGDKIISEDNSLASEALVFRVVLMIRYVLMMHGKYLLHTFCLIK